MDRPRAAEMTLAEWCERFMSLARRLADTTQQTYRRDLDRYVLPRFGSYQLGRLAGEEIEEWLLDEIDSGLAASSVHRHYRTLHRVLEVAVKNKRIASNPCAGVQPPTVPRRRMVILDWPLVFDLADGLPSRYRALTLLAVDSGMRWSELVGLRRSRVDMKACKIEVVEQLIRLNTGEWVRHPPKSEAGIRTIAISPFTARMLAEHMEQFSGPGIGRSGVREQGGQPADRFELPHALLQACARRRRCQVPLPRPAPHQRRAGHPVGCPREDDPVRMGHASIAVTLDRYGHLFPELDEAIATAFDKALVAADTARRAPGVSDVA